jgi:hypothetical protein
MKQATHASGLHSDRSRSFSSSDALPVEVFYVVRSAGDFPERAHSIRSDLYETRSQANTERARLQDADPDSNYGVWKSATYVEPAEWLHRVVRFDGTLVLPRLRGAERIANF